MLLAEVERSKLGSPLECRKSIQSLVWILQDNGIKVHHFAEGHVNNPYLGVSIPTIVLRPGQDGMKAAEIAKAEGYPLARIALCHYYHPSGEADYSRWYLNFSAT